ncbi:MAG: class I SAM-dependent methyltransferase [Nitrospinota bacterium]|nr:class I SAM-dependent methyltransferase [Nitrospinota bacterium]
MTEIIKELSEIYKQSDEGIFIVDDSGYWSNLNRDENAALIESLKIKSPREAIKESPMPQLETVIFSPKRPAGLELLKLKGTEVCIDFGCMWGALTIPLAKMSKFVMGVDQTIDSLRFLMARARSEKLENVATMCNNLKKFPELKNKIDVAVVNGVLEWIPESNLVELKNYFGKSEKREYSKNPGEEQKEFLRNVLNNLKKDGRLYLAIENRYDFKMFFGAPDPHANILFASILPRRMASILSKFKLKRPYVNWLYSFRGIKELLLETGYAKVDLYCCFPDYRYPEKIFPYENGISDFSGVISPRNSKGKLTLKRAFVRAAELIIFRYLKLKSLSPSIIAIAHK